MTVPPKPRRKQRKTGEKPRPPQRVITMRNSQSSGARLHRWRVEPSSGLARRHWAAGWSPSLRSFSSTFLRPFAPGPLRPFLALMDALTPTRTVAAAHGLFPAATRSAPRQQVSLIHAPGLPTIPSPTTGASPGRLRTSSRSRPDNSPHLAGIGFRSSSDRLTVRVGRIEFALLRTGRSPPAAPHPVSPRRSCRLVTV
jgi:hypothetical protein